MTMTGHILTSSKIWLFLALIVGISCPTLAQDTIAMDDTLRVTKVDTLYCDTIIKVDSTLLGKTIFDVLPSHNNGDSGEVSVNQSYAVWAAFQRHIAQAQFKELNGYRIRIYFSNAQNAREASMAAAQLFQSHFAGYNVYRQFVNPNFKVTVGDFRTKSEALAFLTAVRGDFPAAFIVRETIHYTY